MVETIKSPNNNSENYDNQWGDEYQKSVPPFNPERRDNIVDDGEIVQKFLENDDDRRDQLIGWIKRQKNGGGLDEDALAESEKYGSEGEWVAAMNMELDERERQQETLVEAYQAQGQKPEFRDKTLEEILKIQSNNLSEYIGQVAETVSEEKLQELTTRRNDMDDVAQRLAATRKYS